jgi:hypothetical protein
MLLFSFILLLTSLSSVGSEYHETIAAKQSYGPLLFASNGCSESSATYSRASKMISNVTGLSVYMCGQKESFDVEKNIYAVEYLKKGVNKNIAIANAMKDCYNDNSRKDPSSIMVATGLYSNLNHALSTFPFMRSINATFAATYRSNYLDYFTCNVRDCFGKHHSYPVDEKGKHSDMCFSRRKIENKSNGQTKEFAKIDIQELLGQLDHSFAAKASQENGLLKQGLLRKGFMSYKSEDLLAFEQSGKGNLERSVRTWANLLSNEFHIRIPKQNLKNKITSFLKGHSNYGNYVIKSQRSYIYNYDEVEKILKSYKGGRYAWMLRP